MSLYSSCMHNDVHCWYRYVRRVYLGIVPCVSVSLCIQEHPASIMTHTCDASTSVPYRQEHPHRQTHEQLAASTWSTHSAVPASHRGRTRLARFTGGAGGAGCDIGGMHSTRRYPVPGNRPRPGQCCLYRSLGPIRLVIRIASRSLGQDGLLGNSLGQDSLPRIL